MKLKELRIKKRLSQSDLAKKTCISERTIQHYEQDPTSLENAALTKIVILCLALNCKIEDLVDDERLIQCLRTIYSNTNIN